MPIITERPARATPRRPRAMNDNESIPGPLVLASSSPRRRALLAEAGVCFEVIAPAIDEPDLHRSPGSVRQQAEALAFFKARSVAESRPGVWVLGADTLVALGERALGKPADASEARAMLAELSRSPHEVVTGVALLGPEGRRTIASDVTRIFMRPMTEAELDAYVASGEWEGKAGAYAIQETADRYVRRVEGSFTNVVGLPMELVVRMLGRAGEQEARCVV